MSSYDDEWDPGEREFNAMVEEFCEGDSYLQSSMRQDESSKKILELIKDDPADVRHAN